MDFIDQILTIASRIEKQREHIQTEEASKQAFVMPFISALGYNLFDPTEVVPEYTADIGVKKGEKVDYAIMRDGRPIILIECKWSGLNLDATHASQLYRYFSVTEARVGVLTNGIVYKLFSDLDEPNKMDAKPFLELDMLNIQEPLVHELKKLTKSAFDLEEVISAASELKYMKAIKRVLAEQLQHPEDEFVKFFVGRVYSGRSTQQVRSQFTDFVRRAFQQFINERISNRLKSALEDRGEPPEPEPEPATGEPDEERRAKPADGIVTTEEELEGLRIVKAIICDVVDVNRVSGRDSKSYFRVLLDDNSRKQICRLRFNRPQKYLGLFDGDKYEDRVAIGGVDEIYAYSDRLKARTEQLVAAGGTPVGESGDTPWLTDGVEWHRSQAGEASFARAQDLIERLQAEGLADRVSYDQKHYVGVWSGRRMWMSVTARPSQLQLDVKRSGCDRAELARRLGLEELAPDMELKDKLALGSSVTIHERDGRETVQLRLNEDTDVLAGPLLEFYRQARSDQ